MLGVAFARLVVKGHPVTPPTRHGSDIHENWTIQFFRALESRSSPRIPIYGLRHRSYQVCRSLAAKVIGTRLRTIGGHHGGQSEPQKNRNSPTHASQIQDCRISYKRAEAMVDSAASLEQKRE